MEKRSDLIERLTQAFTAIPFNHMLGFELDQVDASEVTLSFKMKPELVGNFIYGILHGGVISSVLDMAGGMVVMSSAIHQNAERSTKEITAVIGKTSTIDLHINYVNPGRGEIFTAKAWLIKRGKKISFTRMELLNQDDDLIATGNATYIN